MKEIKTKSRIGVRVSGQTKEFVDEMSKTLGLNQSELIERLILNYRRGRFSKDRQRYRVRLAKAFEALSASDASIAS